GSMGLLALFVIAPKHAQRQERLERMADSRVRPFAEHSDNSSAASDLPPADTSPQADGSEEEHETVSHPLSRSVLPLMMFFAAVLAMAATAVGVARYLRMAEDRAERRLQDRSIP